MKGCANMQISFLMRLSMTLTTATIVACSSSNDFMEGTTSTSVIQTADYVDDAVINSTVKTALQSEGGLIGGRIDVASFRDVVELDGVVDNAEAKLRAGELAAETPGVRAVRNNLVVR